MVAVDPQLQIAQDVQDVIPFLIQLVLKVIVNLQPLVAVEVVEPLVQVVVLEIQVAQVVEVILPREQIQQVHPKQAVQVEQEQLTELEELLLTQSPTRVEVEDPDMEIHQDARQVAQVEAVKVVLELKEQEKLELVILAVEVDLALDLELIWGELEDQVSLF